MPLPRTACRSRLPAPEPMPAVPRTSIFSALPPIWPEDVLPELQRELRTHPHPLVVLDDDPTGTQTVHDIAVVTQWDPDTLRAEFARNAPGFYVLTNSRALSSEAARV